MSKELPDPAWSRSLRRRVLNWFTHHARELPWRRTRDPYRIWVSEIMLQQTQVATVVPYFERFVATFPNVRALAQAREEQVLRLWEGLGYYRRARQMYRAARMIVERHGGEFPTDLADVRSLPGIGRYTAGAILSIAFDARQPILEANTVRLFSRLSAYRGDTHCAEGQKHLWQFAAAILPRTRTGAFNQALMELGATICVPREPRCGVCPAAPLCPTRAQGLQAKIPLPAKTTNYEDAHEACVVIWKRKRVLLRCCGIGERWSGLWDFPRFPLNPPQTRNVDQQLVRHVRELTGITMEPSGRLTTLRHGVTRFRITLDCYQGAWCEGHARNKHLRWVKPEDLDGYPLSMTARKIAAMFDAG